VAQVHEVLENSGMDPSLLTLELTETTLMRNVARACEQLEAIRALGVRIALDDFGTGYASLSNLQRVPVDILKIDMSFVAALSEGDHGRKLLEAVLGVGRTLSLTVVAEGVEELSQMEALREIGCEMAQGYLIAMPERANVINSGLGSRALHPGVGVASFGVSAPAHAAPRVP